MQGKIIRGVGGFYYVHVPDAGLIECKAKGVFRKRNMKPLVGDDVVVELLDKEKQLGNIQEILPRKSVLLRPAVANVDQAVILFAASYPRPNLNLLDRFLLMMKWQNIPVKICFNKMDMVTDDFVSQLQGIYNKSGAQLLFTSAYNGDGLDALRDILSGKTTVLAGPSGVGKSSVMNEIFPDAGMETGEISAKIKRGKHTTRHSELFFLPHDTYVMDTPGFTSLMLPDLEKEALKDYYEEFIPYSDGCKFLGCVHIHEPECQVKQAIQQGHISQNRYENYKIFFEELQHRKKY